MPGGSDVLSRIISIPVSTRFTEVSREGPVRDKISLQTLAKKMTVLYKLSKEQLSKQHHYDFGLRNIKAVLVRAGELKRITQDMPEDMILMKSLK